MPALSARGNSDFTGSDFTKKSVTNPSLVATDGDSLRLHRAIALITGAQLRLQSLCHGIYFRLTCCFSPIYFNFEMYLAGFIHDKPTQRRVAIATNPRNPKFIFKTPRCRIPHKNSHTLSNKSRCVIGARLNKTTA
jgi:hypothetical protein